MDAKHSIDDERKKEFAGVYVLDYMVNTPFYPSVFLEGEDEDLEPVLEWLMVRNLVEIRESDNRYVPTTKGRKTLENFLNRYSEYLNAFDIYCAVDLQRGEFAFERYFEFEDADEWKKYIDLDRWEDMRVAVADYKKMDPVEIVFMSFIAEGRFGRDTTGWQFDLLLGSVWDEILDICNFALRWEDLGYKDEEGEVPAENVIEDIIVRGAEILIALHEREAQLAHPPTHNATVNGRRVRRDDEDWGDYDEVRMPPPPPPEHYHHYRDPLWVAPAFLGLWLIL